MDVEGERNRRGQGARRPRDPVLLLRDVGPGRRQLGFRNPNRRSAAYRSLHINISRDRSAYADLPMPRNYPELPHHSLVARYFDQYVDRFGLRERITFNAEVTRAVRLAPHHWRVTLGSGEEREYAVLIVANGHH
jgi:cation diffusion facilitator CzcD-associated flavoprotein CzcO